MASPTRTNQDIGSLSPEPPASRRPDVSDDIAILVILATCTVILHVLTGSKYGFHRDELATLEDARHLTWGYVAYPPITPFFGYLSLKLFGATLVGFRFFAALAQAIAVVLAGLMALELGGGRKAQIAAALAAVPFCLGGGALMQYVAFDCLFWVLTAYFVVRLCKSGDPRWWIAIGSAIGLGMLAKYTIIFLVAGLVAGVLLTDARRYLKSKWLWYGVGASLLIFSPHLIWQAQHHFVSLDFLRYIHERDIRIGRTKDFLPAQLELTLLGIPFWVAGVYFYLFSINGKRFRVLGWMYVLPLVLFVIAKGRGYYLLPAYPMLYAAGGVLGERWLQSLSSGKAKAVQGLAWSALAVDIVVISALFLPITPIGSRWWHVALQVNNDFREEIGWPDLAETVAHIRNSLPPAEQAHAGILAGNYGEAGAINLYGPRYRLPPAISGINSFWARGYGNPPPETVITIGISQRFLQRNFYSCQLAGHTWNRYSVANEESEDHPDIYVCRGLRQSWPEFWKNFQYYG